MKKKILVTILMVLMYMILVSCNSCTSSSAQGNKESSQPREYAMVTQDTVQKYEMTQDTVKSKTDSVYVSFTFTPVVEQESLQTVVVKRQIHKKMEVDTSVKVKDTNYEKLEKTQMDIKEQQKVLDSMLIVIKKK